MIRVEKYKTSDYQETSWSGGRTTQLYLFPAQSSYGERNFQFRLSTASMDTEQSTFTSLPSYHRILLSLDQTIVLQDMNSGEQVILAPYHIHRFEGEQSIQCVGKAQDFNIIFDDSVQADLQVMEENKWVVECEADFRFIYALVNLDFHIEGWGSGHLAAKELLVVETNELPPLHLHLTACQACQKPKALTARLRSTDLGRNMI
ncbi:TPA: HutD family protein [Streptococcus suis]|nr:HutD family protein [Streptococcus suis]HEM5490474.1 HutD family protein [Streptococcus suis]